MMNHKLLVPAAVRLDQARHKAKRAYGRHRIVVSNGTSDTYRENYDRIFRKKRRPDAEE